MSQKQYTTYQSDILSFELREAMLGVLSPGRYSGFTTMSANGSPSGGSIPLTISHTGGIQKLAKNSSSLDASIGVVVTTQGVIIHEDQNIGVTITDNSGGGDIKYSLIYMEHEYQDGISGPNPATYGVINGSAGGGIPSLTLAYKRSVIGVVVQIAGSASIAGCSWSPRPSDNILGDTQLFKKLFGTLANYDLFKAGDFPSDGAIGQRVYSEENYVVSGESLSDSIEALDVQLALVSDLADEIDLRPLDSEDWPDFSDVTVGNASTTAHGFLPKLPNDADVYLNGVGGWAAFPASLLAENNLNDLANKAEARANLGLITALEIEQNYFEDTGWLPLTRDIAASSTDFDIKIRRLGRLCMVQGTFKDGSNTVQAAIIAKIDLNTLALGGTTWVATSEKIHFPCGTQIADTQYNRGMYGYVKAYSVADTQLELRVDQSSNLGNNATTKFNINFTFIAEVVDDIIA